MVSRPLLEITFIDGSKLRAVDIHVGQHTGKIIVGDLAGRMREYWPDDIKEIKIVEVSGVALLYEKAKKI